MEKKKQDDKQVYLEERKQSVSAERDTAQQFDKAILTLAAGALALSLTFINQVAPHPKSNSIFFLVSAWSLFCISLCLTLISFLTSQAACRRYREILDADILEKSDNSENIPARWTNWLNYLSISFFILGIVFLIIFSATNLSKGGENMPKDKKDQAGYVPAKPPVKPDKIDEGYVPPKQPVKPPEKPNTSKK